MGYCICQQVPNTDILIQSMRWPWVGGELLYLSTGTKHRHFDTKYEVALGGREATVFINRYQTQTF